MVIFLDADTRVYDLEFESQGEQLINEKIARDS